MKKILIIINNLGVGGAERLVVEDINEMINRGVLVRLLTLKKENKYSLFKDLNLDNKFWATIPFGSLLNIKSWWKVYRYISKERPDALIAHLWFSNFIGRIIGKVCGVKTIIIFEQNVYDNLKTKKMFLADRLLQKLSSHIIAVSEAVKISLINHGINRNKIIVIRNSVNISKYLSVAYDDIRKTLGISSAFLYVFIGRLIDQKGVDILIRALDVIKEGILLIVGQGPERGNLEILTKKLHLDSRVIFMGVRDDIPDILNSSDCFVLPSRYEGLPMVLVEAMAAGKAIIVSDFDAAKEIIKNESNGLIVKKENVDELATAMLRIKDDNLGERLGIQARKDSEALSIVAHVDKIMSLI